MLQHEERIGGCEIKFSEAEINNHLPPTHQSTIPLARALIQRASKELGWRLKCNDLDALLTLNEHSREMGLQADDKHETKCKHTLKIIISWGGNPQCGQHHPSDHIKAPA